MMDRKRRGNITYTVLAFPVMLGMAALAVDLGQVRVADAQLQAVTDGVAAAAAGHLDGTQEGMTLGEETGLALAANNSVFGGQVYLPPEDLEFGWWGDWSDELNESDYEGDIYSARVFYPHNWAPWVNAVRVTTRARVPTFFASLALGRRGVTVSSQTIALRDARGAGSVECYIPLAVPDCAITQFSKSTVADMTFVFTPAGIDNAGYARRTSQGHPDAAYLMNQVQDCTYSGEVWVGDEISLDNGQKAAVVITLADEVDASATYWDSWTYGSLPAQDPDSRISNYGYVLEGPIMVFEGTEDYCAGNGSWTETNMPLTGFAWGAIYDVTNKNVKMKLDMRRYHDWGAAPGGENFGVVVYVPQLVD